MSKLTNNEKLFILYSKGWFRGIEDVKELILTNEYALDAKQVDDSTVMHFVIGLYHKLYKLGCILENHPSPLMYMMEQVNKIGKSPLAPSSLYEILYSDISFTDTDKLGLEDVQYLHEQDNINTAIDNFKQKLNDWKENQL